MIILPANDDPGSDEDPEIEMAVGEPSFLRGQTRMTMQHNPVNIVKVSNAAILSVSILSHLPLELLCLCQLVNLYDQDLIRRSIQLPIIHKQLPMADIEQNVLSVVINASSTWVQIHQTAKTTKVVAIMLVHWAHLFYSYRDALVTERTLSCFPSLWTSFTISKCKIPQRPMSTHASLPTHSFKVAGKPEIAPTHY